MLRYRWSAPRGIPVESSVDFCCGRKNEDIVMSVPPYSPSPNPGQSMWSDQQPPQPYRPGYTPQPLPPTGPLIQKIWFIILMIIVAFLLLGLVLFLRVTL